MKDRNIKNTIASYIKLADSIKSDYGRNLLSGLIANYEQNILQNNKPTSMWVFIFKSLFSNYTVTYNGSASKKMQLLLWPVQLNHLDYQIPVYHEIAAKTDTAFVCLRKDLLKILNNHKLPVIEVKIRHRFLPSIHGLKRTLALLSIITKAKFTKEINRENINHLIATLQQFSYYDIYSQLFYKVQHDFKPKYHLLGYEHSVVCRPINILANQLNIPVGNIQHGAINENLIPYSICKNQFVWNHFVKDQYKNTNLNVYVTGSPNYNHQKNHSDLPENFNTLFEHDNIILVCYSGPGHNVTVNGHKRNLNALLQIVRKARNYRFVIKLHNKDKVQYYAELMKELNVAVIDQDSVSFRVPIINFIEKSSLVITGASTVSLEAIQHGKLVICMDLNKELQHIEFIRNELFYHCESEEEFEKSINAVLNSDNSYMQKQKMVANFQKECDLLQTDNPTQKISNFIIQSINLCAE